MDKTPRNHFVAKLSIGMNLVHLACTLAIQRIFLPTTTSAFPTLARIFLWTEFILIVLAWAPLTDLMEWKQANPPPDVEDYSITSTKATTTTSPKISRSDWVWMSLATAAFALLLAIIFNLHSAKL
jgi:hypothetical protein